MNQHIIRDSKVFHDTNYNHSFM